MSAQTQGGTPAVEALAPRSPLRGDANAEALRRENTQLRAELKNCASRLDRTNSILLAEISHRRQLTDWFFQAKEQYRRIFDNAIEGIFLCTTEGYLFSANRALALIYDFEAPAELIAEIREISGYFVDPKHTSDLKDMMKRGAMAVGFECEARRRDGVLIRLLMDIRPVRDGDGLVLYYEGLVEDVTERQRLREQLWAAQKLKAAGHLFATIASEFTLLDR